MKTIKICNLPIDIHNGPVAISHSGGADSSLLLYILMNYCNGPIHVYTCASKQKHRTTARVSGEVINRCMDLIDRSDIYHHVYYTDLQTFDTLFNPLFDMLDSNLYNIKYLYTGVTCLPPVSESFKFINEMPLINKRDPNIKRTLYNGKNKNIYSPFFNIDKKYISNIYSELKIVDTIFSVTRSCEDLTLTAGHCGKCWWCEERLWAFNKLE